MQIKPFTILKLLSVFGIMAQDHNGRQNKITSFVPATDKRPMAHPIIPAGAKYYMFDSKGNYSTICSFGHQHIKHTGKIVFSTIANNDRRAKDKFKAKYNLS